MFATSLEHQDPWHRRQRPADSLLPCRFMAFDRHMNLVLGDAEEFRKLPPKKGKSDTEVACAVLGLLS